MVSAGKVEPEEIDSVCQGFVLDQHEVARLQKSRLWLHKKNSEEVNDYICRKICGGRVSSVIFIVIFSLLQLRIHQLNIKYLVVM